ncbi:MAG: hypothetical protein ISQ90_07765, partial [Rhodospirillales bacterium]|nr:hypothetical protein [Rhodospirillales bacterium]
MPIYLTKALTAFGLISVALYIWVVSEEFPANGHQIPQFTSGMTIFICLFLLFDAFESRKSAEKAQFDFSFAANKQYFVLLLSIIFVPTIFAVGFFTASFFFISIWSGYSWCKKQKGYFFNGLLIITF